MNSTRVFWILACLVLTTAVPPATAAGSESVRGTGTSEDFFGYGWTLSIDARKNAAGVVSGTVDFTLLYCPDPGSCGHISGRVTGLTISGNQALVEVGSFVWYLITDLGSGRRGSPFDQVTLFNDPDSVYTLTSGNFNLHQ